MDLMSALGISTVIAFLAGWILSPDGNAKSAGDVSLKWAGYGVALATITSFPKVLQSGGGTNEIASYVVVLVAAAVIAAVLGAIWGFVEFKGQPIADSVNQTVVNASSRAIEKIRTFDILKTDGARVSGKLKDEDIYETASEELKENNIRPGLWAIAFAECEGDESKAKALYIKLRVQQLKENTIESNLGQTTPHESQASGFIHPVDSYINNLVRQLASRNALEFNDQNSFNDHVTGIRKEYGSVIDSALNGDAAAQYDLGYILTLGLDDDKKTFPLFPEEGFSWCEKSASAGNIKSQALLGYLYNTGTGVPPDPYKAFKHFYKAAKQGDAIAQTELGYKYISGSGVEKDELEGIKWLIKAAEQDNSRAQYILAINYLDGERTELRDRESYKWFSKSAKQQDIVSKYMCGFMATEGIGTKKDVNLGNQLTHDAESMNNLSEKIRFAHVLLEFNHPKAADISIQIISELASTGNADCEVTMGWCHMKGLHGFKFDSNKAISWNRLGWVHGHPEGANNLGEIYENGIGVPIDIIKAKRWYSNAAGKGNKQAIERLEALERKYPDED